MTEATTKAKATPAAFADEKDREATAGVLATLGDLGWTRPAIRAALDSLETPLTDSAVYRAQRNATHIREVDIWKAFFQAVDDGKVQPPEKARKVKASDMVDRAAKAAALLASVAGEKSIKTVKEIVAEALTLLPEPVVEAAPEPEVASPEGEQHSEAA
jgi:hypothetical protein